ncbi:hypothetical protein [Burkholderia pseudomallei]|nr:hypothetical protein [Burkholderia pseudomallei]MCW0032056.1 hypothetical protein [Burkholderia pseudomallei]MCW0088622.1 hypothetical protein [Burkholderia pseudomallei]MCW0109236.1 hypothetical protein [Burkholderia pseudomallei]CAK0156586.1 Uncharacterised protein [Burkholderia pseudomallei]
MKQLATVVFALVCAAVIGHTVAVELRHMADNVHAAIVAQVTK